MVPLMVAGLLFFWFTNAGCNQSSARQQQNKGSQTIESVDASRFKQLVESSECVLVDVRTPEEYRAGHIEGARLMNIYDPDFVRKVEDLPKDKAICVYCRSGNRSMRAAHILAEKGFKKIYNLSGGIRAWQHKGYPVER